MKKRKVKRNYTKKHGINFNLTISSPQIVPVRQHRRTSASKMFSSKKKGAGRKKERGFRR